MTDKSEKVDGYVPRWISTGEWLWNYAGGIYFSAVEKLPHCFFGKCEIVPVRIIPASDPTAAEARAEVIRELREWEAEQHTVWMASLGQLFVEQVLSDLRANLTELERVK